MRFNLNLGHTGKNVTIVLALLGAGFFAAYLRFKPYLDTQGQYTDGDRMYSGVSDDVIRYAVWDDPRPLSSLINSSDAEGRATLSPDGRYLVFAVGEEGINGDLYMAEMVDGEWIDPRPLAPLNTDFDETAPAFTNDALYFASNRPGGAGGLDIYRVSFLEGLFGELEALPEEINSEWDDTEPAPVPGSHALAFASNRKQGMRKDYDLYFARPGLQLPNGVEGYLAENLTPVNTPFDERDPALAADGRSLFFATNRDDAVGEFDLFRSVREQVEWLPAQPLQGVNTELSERFPSPSDDGFSMFFSASAADGNFDIYRTRSLELFRVPGRPVGWVDLAVLSVLLLLALLAFLAKRWERLDILYKCLLISVLLHLLMMWWFRRVHPESGDIQVPAGEPSFKVTLAASQPGQNARLREMGGSLEATREQLTAEAELDRAESAELADRPAQIADRAVARAQPAPTPSPERAVLPSPERSEEAMEVNVAKRDVSVSAPQPENFDRMDASAPQVALDAQTAESAERSASGDIRDPNRAESAETGVGAATPKERASQFAKGAPEWTPEQAPTQTDRSQATVDNSEAFSAAVATPGETVQRQDGSVPEFKVVATKRAQLKSDRSGGFLSRPSGMAPQQDRQATPKQGELNLPSQPGYLAGEEAVAVSSQNNPALGPTATSSAPEVAMRAPQEDDYSPYRRGVPAFEVETPGSAVEFDRIDPLSGLASPQRTAFEQPSRNDDLAAGPVRRQLDRADREVSDREGAETYTERNSVDVERNFGDGPAVALDDRDSDLPAREMGEGNANDVGDLALAPTTTNRPVGVTELEPTRREFRPSNQNTEQRRPDFKPLETLAREDSVEVEIPPTKLDHTPYRTRFGSEKKVALAKHGGSAETEKAVANGLEYLAGVQQPLGHWGSRDDFHDKYGYVAIGKTGLALLAFLGAGHDQNSDTQYAPVVRRALEFLLNVQDPDSGHFGYTTAYGHGIATYAIAECYAITQDEKLREPLEMAIRHIRRNQNQTRDHRRFGGWGYFNSDGPTYDSWPRVSVTAWQVMALESARLGGVEIPDRVFEDSRQYLLKSYDQRKSWFRYNHNPTRLRSSYPTLPASTPAALFVLSLLGEDINDARFDGARVFTVGRAPTGYRYTGEDDFVLRARGNVYFWYYGSLAMFRAQGEVWDRWNDQMKRTLLPSQETDGSWKPLSVYADYAGDDSQDRSYTTALCVLTLEVYYRYFTPLLKVK